MRYSLRFIAISLSALFIFACTPERKKPGTIDFTALCQVGEVAPKKQNIFKDSVESTVRIYTITRDTAFFNMLTEGYGTGVIIDDQAGLILTAAHLVKDAVLIEATTRKVNNQGKIEDGESMYLTVLSADYDYDTAVLMVKKQCHLPSAMPLHCEWMPAPGRKVAQFGQATRMSPGKVMGYYVKVFTNRDSQVEIMTDAFGQAGDSGGPFIEAESGRLVGLLLGGFGQSGFESVFVSLADLIKCHQGKKPK